MLLDIFFIKRLGSIGSEPYCDDNGGLVVAKATGRGAGERWRRSGKRQTSAIVAWGGRPLPSSHGAWVSSLMSRNRHSTTTQRHCITCPTRRYNGITSSPEAERLFVLHAERRANNSRRRSDTRMRGNGGSARIERIPCAWGSAAQGILQR